MCNRTDCAGSWAGAMACAVCRERDMNNTVMHEYFTAAGEIMDCNCHNGDSELIQTADGKWQVACDGCGMRGPAGSKLSAAHEWNLIVLATTSSFSFLQLAYLDCIEKCRQRGKDEKSFVDNLRDSMQSSEDSKAKLLQKMRIAQ